MKRTRSQISQTFYRLTSVKTSIHSFGRFHSYLVRKIIKSINYACTAGEIWIMPVVCTNVHFLVKFYSRVAKCYPYGKLDEEHTGFSVLLLATACEYKIMSKEKSFNSTSFFRYDITLMFCAVLHLRYFTKLIKLTDKSN